MINTNAGTRSRNNQPLRPTLSLAQMTASESQNVFKTYDKLQHTDEKEKNPYTAMGKDFKTIEMNTSNMLRGRSAHQQTRYRENS